MHERPNILLIMTDQQRADTVGALGSPWAMTPCLDALASAGTAFSECFVTSPVCVSSRASLFRGVYPHSTNVYTNFEPWEPSWVATLAQAGYHCVNIGKMHINPYGADGGFHQRFVVENKDRPLFLDEHERAFYDEWDKALKAHGVVKPSRYTRSQTDRDGFLAALGCFDWELDEALHPDVFVGSTAAWWLAERKAESPFFLQVGFPGPHPPYDPPARWLDHYRGLDLPLEPASEAELAGQPSMHAALRETMKNFNIDSVAWRDALGRDDLLRLRRYYLANVSLIEAQVERILAALQARGQLENTLVLFTSDHADALGDHGHIQKWTMYDCVNRVPLIARLPQRSALGDHAGAPRGAVCTDLVQLMDLAPTIFEFAGIEPPSNWEAKSLAPMLANGAWNEPVFREHVYAELGRDHIQSAAEYVIMRRDRKYKYVIYPGTEEGELYDLGADPGETRNLWRDPRLAERRDRAVAAILEWSVLGAYRAHRRPAPRPQGPMRVGPNAARAAGRAQMSALK
ncbi:MAG: sulfatase-like hydrolase/transferase [Burkholderiales bacterium]|nr:MAG: sulfatase-like hydrolase/transferase [Burkholderiales bacterium]